MCLPEDIPHFSCILYGMIKGSRIVLPQAGGGLHSTIPRLLPLNINTYPLIAYLSPSINVVTPCWLLT
jgi:hypothetical protein